MIPLQMFRSTAKALPDLLNYAALVDSGVVRGKDGSLLAGFFFRGEDAASSTTSELNWTTQRVNDALKDMGTGWVTWVEAGRVEAPGYSAPEASHFQSFVTGVIDAERRETFATAGSFFESEYAIILQYLPPIRRNNNSKGGAVKGIRRWARPIDELIMDDDGQEEAAPDAKIMANFQKALSDLEDRLEGALRLRRMGGYEVVDDFGVKHLRDELVNYLRYTVTGQASQVDIPPCPMYLDAYLVGQELFAGTTPKLGDKFICTVGIEGFPSASYPGLLSVLDTLPITYRWSTRFIHLDANEAQAALDRYLKKWQQKIRGLWSQVFKTSIGTINTDALDMSRQAEAAINEVNSGLVAYGYYTPVVVLMHESREWLAETARYVKREIEREGFAARVESINTMEAWLGTLPGHPAANVRRPAINTMNLADLLPLSSVWPGLPTNPCDFYEPGSPPLLFGATTGATPFRLNLHVSDLGHTLIFGPPGAGKSTLLGLIAAQFDRYKNGVGHATVMAFDKGESLLPLALASGRHYAIGGDADGSPSFCPLAHIDSASDMAWAEEFVVTCYELQADRPATPRQKEEIHSAMRRLREGTSRSMTDYAAEVQDADVRAALAHYTVAGAMGHLLDAQSDELSISRLSVFEIDELMKLGDKNAIPVLLYLFRRFEKSLKGQPALLCLDEAWVMLGHPVFREKIREWLKDLRKKNCVVAMATQSLSDAYRSGILDVLMEACPTKILLPNKEADKGGSPTTPGPRDLYTMFGLNERQIQIICRATPKRQYYYMSPHGNRLFELALGPIALSFVGVSDKAGLARVRELAGEYGSKWPQIWMQERGVSYERLAA